MQQGTSLERRAWACLAKEADERVHAEGRLESVVAAAALAL